MYSYTYDKETGGLLLNSFSLVFSKEPRPVFYKELDMLGFDKIWKYEKTDSAPYMWAEANNYFYRGKHVAKLKGGSIYSAPEIIELEEAEPKGKYLKLVDLELMIKKNNAIIETLTQSTIKFIYNTYLKYVSKVDLFHVSYSGGKDSEVLLDLVQRALPHDAFVVVFGDTGMEFPDTYTAVETARNKCESMNINFLTAQARTLPTESWKKFGPPSTTIRWCCSVHKTTPQLLKLREYIGKNNFSEMAFVGVRGDESDKRAGYDYISLGTKHKGQYSCNPILDWSSAEVYLYLFANNLTINEAYKKGNSRAGCLICPMASKKNDYMNHSCYKKESQQYVDTIMELNIADKDNPDRLKSYVENIGWRARKNGRDLSIATKDYEEIVSGSSLLIKFRNRNNDWRQWITTLGTFIETDKKNTFKIYYFGKEYIFSISEIDGNYLQVQISDAVCKKEIDFLRSFKRVFRKSHYCVSCQVCQANCKFGHLKFDENNKLSISKDCVKCGQCLDIDTGCLVYKSLWVSKGNGNMKKESLDCYANHPPKQEWIADFLKLGERFWTENGLGNNQVPAFKKFLRHAGLIDKNYLTNFYDKFKEYGLESETIWAIVLVNVSYSPEIGWLIKNIKFDEIVSQKYIKDLLSEEEGISASAIKSIPAALRRISLLPFNNVGYGNVLGQDKETGYSFMRTSWQNPDPKVILYTLFKFAEECGDYYQFSLSRLMDSTIDGNGINPAQIFGIEKETMIGILKGLSINYPEYISVAFTLDLDNINLRHDKKSSDILDLF